MAAEFSCGRLQSALSSCPKVCFGLEKLINFTIFVEGDDNKLEINYLRDHASEYAQLLIPYFMAYVVHYFYNSKTRGYCRKGTSDSEST